MSRTIRKRKGYKQGRYGQGEFYPNFIDATERERYTYTEWYRVNTCHSHNGVVHDFGDYVIIEETKASVNRINRFLNRDSQTGVFSVPKRYTQKFEAKLRMYNKQELIKFLNKEDYEVLCSNKPADASWYYY